MKSLVVSSTLLLAFAVVANAKPHHQWPPHKVAAKDACLTKLGLTEEKLHENRESEVDGKGRNCFAACILKEIGVITAEGIIDREAAIKDFPPYVSQENRTKIIDACHEQKGADDCETAELYHVCVKKLKPRPPMNAELEKIFDSCKEKLSLSDEDIHKMKHSRNETKNCFSACVNKGIGFLKEDGSFDKELFVEKSPADKKETAQKVAEECAAQVVTDECETATLLHKCFKKNDFKIGDVFYPPPASPTQEA